MASDAARATSIAVSIMIAWHLVADVEMGITRRYLTHPLLGGLRNRHGVSLSFGGISPPFGAHSRPALRQHDIARAGKHGIG